MMAEDRTEWRP